MNTKFRLEFNFPRRGRFFAGALAIGAGVMLSSSALAATKKNVMLIMVDDLRPQLNGFAAIPGLHGESLMRTPALDALSAESTIFQRAYCSVPICGASRLSLLTGSRPYKEPGQNWGRHWTYTSRLELEDAGTPAGTNNPGITMPQHFKNNGYKLYSVDKVYHNKADDAGVWDDLVKENHPWKDVPAFEIGTGEKNQDDAYPDGRNTTDVIAKLETLKDEAFFYGVGFPRPHLPFWAPEKYWDMYPESEIRLPPNYSLPVNAPAQSIHKWEELRNYSGVVYEGESQAKLTDDYARTLVRGYYASVSYVDAQIARIIEKLKTTHDADGVSLYDKTIIVVWGDHGWNLGEHTLWAKHALYNTSAQIPILIRDPDRAKGQSVSKLIESVDLYPTLCELAGIGRPQTTIDNDGSVFDLHGSSLVPLLEDSAAPWKPAAYVRYGKGDSVRTERYAYTEFVDVNDKLLGSMLYDLQYDPGENYNIVDYNPELQEKLRELLGKTATEKRNAWRQLVDETRDNEPLGIELDLPEAKHPKDYLQVLADDYGQSLTDTDGDGFDAVAEHAFGSNPFMTESRFRAETQFSDDEANALSVRFGPLVEGREYELEHSVSLVKDWTRVGLETVEANRDSVVYTFPIEEGGRAFYRVKAKLR